MAYEVIARKWRPQQFDDVVGQKHVVTTLKNAIQSNRVAHAYLFVGPRGVGKTTIARIFARALNCIEGPAVQACGKCDSCLEISKGVNLDVQEIDAASNRGIDNIRELRESARFVPTGRFKIYIIDEVHMLTSEAFNALLKTLEEPPPHLKFFMATTDPQKIPATILSRCQRFDLRRIPVPLIIERLELIARDEKIEIEKEALSALARAAEGGLRDAQSALDQMISFQGKKITEEDVLNAFGLVSGEALEKIADALLGGMVLSAVKILAELDEHGKDMQRLLVELLEHLRDLLVFIEVGAEAADGLIEGNLAVLARQALQTNAPCLLRMTDVLMDTLDRLRYALSKKTLVETAFIRCAHISGSISLDSILSQLYSLQKQLGELPPDAKAAKQPSAASVANSRQAATQPPKVAPKDTTTPPAPKNAELNLPSASRAIETPDVDLTRLRRDWRIVIDVAGRSAVRARSALLDTAPLSVTGEKVTIGVDREFADRLEVLSETRPLQAVKKALAEVLRRPVEVEFELADGLASVINELQQPLAEKEADSPEQPDPMSKNALPSPESSETTVMDEKLKWIENKKVQKVLDVFNGDIKKIRE